ncbi:MAG: glycosyltransferase [Candidatus Sedimenticola sp. (ex Thyasira tokunagai)]
MAAKTSMSQPPIISICIANYNGMDVIDDCLKSVMTQSGGLAVEIIVHDDASSDKSVTHIREHYPDVKLIESEKNVGFCIANNRMAAIAHGEYLLLLNNDAALYPDALITLHRAAAEVGLPAILGLPQYNFDTGELLDIGSLLDPFLNPIPNKDPHQDNVGMVMGACLWIPNLLWKELDGFPEWLGSIGEDLYLCCIARLTSYPVRALSVSGYRHHVGISFGGGKTQQGKLVTTFRRRALSEQNKTFVMAMTYPTPAMQLIFPIHLLLLLMEGVLLTILKNRRDYFTLIYLPVFRGLIQNREKLLATRRSILGRRTNSLSGFFSAFSIIPYKLRMLLQHGLPHLR